MNKTAVLLSLSFLSLAPDSWANTQSIKSLLLDETPPPLVALFSNEQPPPLVEIVDVVREEPPLVELVWSHSDHAVTPFENLLELRNTILADSVQTVLAQYPNQLTRSEQLHLAELLLTEGKRNQVNPLYLAALIWIESAYETQAISTTGARGLMQLMPATGEEMAQELGIDWLGPNMLHKPTYNVKLGAYYLGRLLSHYNGDYRLALTAYNRGPRNVRFLMHKPGLLNDEYTEYYQRIQETYENYKRSLGVRTALLDLRTETYHE